MSFTAPIPNDMQILMDGFCQVMQETVNQITVDPNPKGTDSVATAIVILIVVPYFNLTKIVFTTP